MKKILTFVIIFQSILTYASNTDEAIYTVNFYVKYSNIDNNFNKTSRIIYNYLYLNNANNKNLGFTITSHIIQTTSSTYHISPQESKFKVNLESSISSNFVEITNPTYKYNIKEIYIKPNKYDLGTGNFQGRFYNQYIGSGTFNLFRVSYHLEIRPERIKCSTSDERELLYEDTICIRATKGFPKEVYKWRYSYKNANGVTIEGNFTPFKTEDNGATIYVKGSDFLNETQFNELVESQNGITIIPDGAEEYNKPLYVESVNLTARPTCPFIIKPIEIIQPKCYGYNAEQVKIKLSRGLLKGEVVKFILTHENGTKVFDSIFHAGKDEIIFDSKNKIEIGNWDVDILGTYLDKDNKPQASYSGGEDYNGKFMVNDKEPLKVLIDSIHTIKCYGENNGEIFCTFQNGNGHYNYILKDTESKEIKQRAKILTDTCVIIGLSPLEYRLSVTDSNGCESENKEDIIIKQPDPILLNASVDSNPKCQGSYDGVIKYNASGGTGNIKCYLQNLLHEVKDSTYSKLFSGLNAGTYYLNATDTNGCTSDTIETFIYEPDALSLSLDIKNVTINGQNNGEITANINGGGTEPYYIIFNNGNNPNYPLDNKVYFYNQRAGKGTISLYDSNGCSTSADYTITEPDTISAIVKQIDFIKCFGDNTASLKIDSIAGGMGGYSVEWNGTDDFTSKETYLGNLSAGYYLVTLKDSVGAKTIYAITIDEPNKINLLSSVTNTACMGEASGSILLNANGGTAPYKFSLNEQYSTNGEYNQLGIGSYNVSVEDENGCTTDSIVEVKTLSDINLNVTSSSPSCYNINNGTISISIDNGVRPYYVRCTDDNFLQVENNLELTNLEAGNYNIEVKDALGCIKTAEAILIQPEEFSFELPEKIYLCNEQSKDINIESERVTNVDWYLNNDLIHTGLNNKLTQEGVYRLDFLYDEQCHSFGEIEVDTINKKVDANFLVAAEIPINDDAHLINITPKESYEYVEWIYPTNEAWVYGEDEHSFQLVFLNEGIYQVGMIAHNDKCTASLFKTIKTFTPSGNNASEDNTYHITELSIDKSPNNGKFISYVNLSAKTDVKLYLYNASTGHIIATEEVSGEKTYEIPFSVNATAGEYILLAVAPQWQKSKWIKMIIK